MIRQRFTAKKRRTLCIKTEEINKKPRLPDAPKKRRGFSVAELTALSKDCRELTEKGG